MRYVRVVLIPEEGPLHPASEAISADPSVTLESIEHINLLNDGTTVALSHHRGDADALAAIMEAEGDVIKFNVSPVEDGVQAYVHSRPNETARALLEMTHEFEFVIDTPIEFEEDGSVRIAVIGHDETVQRAIDNVPDGIRLELEKLSEYEPELRQLSSLLTERQQEILDTAVEVGYYEVPRRATHEDIARELDLSTTTVGEHLRKIEARMLSEIAR